MDIVDKDIFLSMPLSTQCLYFHLLVRADDDGFVDNTKSIMKMINASEDDLNLLILKKFVIPFETGVIVIRHWGVHNTVRADRYKETERVEEKETLQIEKGVYEKLEEKPKRVVRVAAGYDEVCSEKTKKPTRRKPTNHNGKRLDSWDVKDFVNYFNEKFHETTGLGSKTVNQHEEKFLGNLIKSRANNDLLKEYIDVFIEDSSFTKKDIYNFCLTSNQTKLDSIKLNLSKKVSSKLEIPKFILKAIKENRYSARDDDKYLQAVRENPSLLEE